MFLFVGYVVELQCAVLKMIYACQNSLVTGNCAMRLKLIILAACFPVSKRYIIFCSDFGTNV